MLPQHDNIARVKMYGFNRFRNQGSGQLKVCRIPARDYLGRDFFGEKHKSYLDYLELLG